MRKTNKPKIKLSVLRRVISEESHMALRSGHRITPQYIFSSLKQRGILYEEDAQAIPLDQEETGDSLDRQVDRFLAEYETGSKTESEPADQLEWRDLIRGMLLAEAPGDDEDGLGDSGDEEGGDSGDEEGGEQPPAEEEVPEEPKKLGLNNIDVELFSNDVARLIENYDNLLEVRKTLIRRTINFISKNYDETVVKELEAALRDNHGLMVDKSPREHEAEDFTAPSAGQAGPIGA